jgi:hypothetical protein
MSGLGNGRGKVVGLGAAAALALSMMPAGAAQAGAQDQQWAEIIAAARAEAAGLGASATSEGKGVAKATAAAPSACTLKSYAPNKIVVGASKVSKKFSVQVTGCTLDLWLVILPLFIDENADPSAPNFFDGIAGNLPPESGVIIKPTTTLNPRLLTNAEAGKSTAEVTAYGVEDIENPEDVDPATGDLPFQLLRRSTFGSTFNASPEPVKKGKSISIKGTLARINWNGAKTLKYVGFAKAKAQVQFKANGATKYVTVKNVVAGKGGKFSTKVKATKSGRWRLYFAGLSTTAPATSVSDAVKVN